MQSLQEEEKVPAGGEEEEKEKFAELQDEDVHEISVQLKGQKPVVQKFVKSEKFWDNQNDFKIPPDIVTNIINDLNFKNPSGIQTLSIPLIYEQNGDGGYSNIVARAANGSGKTGSFSIGTVLRVDRSIKAIQVLVIVNTRELCNQIHAVYAKLVNNTGITLCNFLEKKENAQIVVTTMGTLDGQLSGRKKLDLKQIKCVVYDEADVFFLDDKNFAHITNLSKYPDIVNQKPQWIFFSATFPEVTSSHNLAEMVTQRQGQIIDMNNTNFIKLSANKIMEKLGHIQQYTMRTDEKKKLDFIQEIFSTCEMTQTFIFVNTKQYAHQIHERLRKSGYMSYIMTSKMTPEERDETMEKFRKEQIHVLIATNILSRGIDVPSTQLVINYDVPTLKVRGTNQSIGDPDVYLHRIGRTGRFGVPGIALTIYDRDVDKKFIKDIVDHFKMESKVGELKGAEHLSELLKEL